MTTTALIVPARRPDTAYRFDAVFGDNGTQADVFSRATPFIDAVFEGYNCSIFTYGQVSPIPRGVALSDKTQQESKLSKTKRFDIDIAVAIAASFSHVFAFTTVPRPPA